MSKRDDLPESPGAAPAPRMDDRRLRAGLASPGRRASLRLTLGGALAALHAAGDARLLLAGQDTAGADVVAEPDSAARERRDNFVLRSPNVLDEMRATSGRPTAGWVLASGAATLAFDPNETRANTGARGCLHLSGLAQQVAIRKDFGSNGIVPNNGVLVVPVKISEMPLTDGDALPAVGRVVAIFIELCSDTAFSASTSTKLATSFFMSSFQFLRSGWNDLQISAADDGTLNTTGTPGWTYSGTSPGSGRTEYRHMRIVFAGFQATATQAPVVTLGGVYQNGRCSANVLLSCDDAHQDTVDIVRIFNWYDVPVSVGVITGIVGQGAQLDVGQVRDLYEDGNDVTAHSVTHPTGQGLTAVTQQQLDVEAGDSRAWLLANGLTRTAQVFIYPENAFGDRELAAVRAAGYAVARGSRPGWTPTLFGIDNPHALGSRDVGGHTLAQVKKYLDAAQVYGCTQAIYSHRIAFVPITSLTIAGGIGTVVHPEQGTRVPPGTQVFLRGFDNDACNVYSTVESGSTTTGFRIRMAGAPNGVAASSEGNCRFFSPTYPAAGGPPPASTLHWYLSDYIALAREIAARRDAGTLRPIGYATLLDRCTLG